ncbi:MAG: NUDIX hydrolase [Actinomycetota bacterium]
MSDDPTLSFVTPRVAAGALFLDESGEKVLMVVPSYKDYLDIPGGYVEHGETPRQAVVREVEEELGIRPPIGPLLVTDWWQDSPESNGGPKVLMVFEGQLDNEMEKQIRVDGQEIVDHRWVDVDVLDGVTIPRLTNRLRLAITARTQRSVLYLENGETTPTASGGAGDVLSSAPPAPPAT